MNRKFHSSLTPCARQRGAPEIGNGKKKGGKKSNRKLQESFLCEVRENTRQSENVNTEYRGRAKTTTISQRADVTDGERTVLSTGQVGAKLDYSNQHD